MKNLDLVILAGGKGSRIKNFTSNPKPIVKFNNLYFLDYLIQNYALYNFQNIYILAGYKGYQINKIYKKRKYNLKKINVIIEKTPMDTGGALYSLKKIIKNNFILVNGDSILDINIDKFINRKFQNDLIRVALISKKFTKNKNKLSNLLPKKNRIIIKNNSPYMNSGSYYCNKKLLNIIENKKVSLENEIIPNLIQENKVAAHVIQNKFF